MTDPVDWTSPCARAAALRDAYFTLLSGDREIEIRTRTLDGEELVKFQPADLAALRSAWQDAEQECAAANAVGAPTLPKRFAIGCRYKRRGFDFPRGSLFRGPF